MLIHPLRIGSASAMQIMNMPSQNPQGSADLPSGMRLRTEAASSSSWAMEWRKARRHLAGGHSHRLAACRRQVCLLQTPHSIKPAQCRAVHTSCRHACCL